MFQDLNIEFVLYKFFTGYFLPFIDIVFITIIIFYIYLFIEKTRAANLTKGLILFFIVLYILNFFDLPIFSWMFNRLISNILIILIIIFSPEIRNVLTALGRKQNLMRLSKEEKEYINIIANASEKLSFKNIGMLLVIERKQEIKNLLTSYLPLNADLTEDILFFIFDKKSLIHDGAAIIKKNKILYVSAVLPLSEKELPEKNMGTRHRAALGITEVSDALTIVVSEETGRISFCENGNIYVNLTVAELKKLLRKFLYVIEE